MGFLGNLVSAHRLYREQGEIAATAENQVAALVIQLLRRTEVFNVISLLCSILLTEVKSQKPASGEAAPKVFPQTMLSLAHQAMRILNDVARLDVTTLQEILGHCRQELYHLLVCLIDYCAARLSPGGKPSAQQEKAEENDLLHETIVLLGFYSLQNEEHQHIMCYGEGHTLLAKVTSLPLHYFMDERGRAVLFPTILATCFQSQHNLELLRGEMNLSLLRSFLASSLAKEAAKPADAARGPSDELDGRFPKRLWQDALEFFSDEAPASAS